MSSDIITTETDRDRLTVHMDGVPVYDIVLKHDFSELAAELKKLGIENKKLCIVTDSNVSELYREQVDEILSGCCKTVVSFVFPAGEENKNLESVKALYEQLILARFDRSDMLVALGGGVVGDLCGYGAATYLRGIDFIQIPTTLLSQVDSSIGGKTGVDFDAYKNMVGAFHMPKLVYTNISTLLSLPDSQFSAGMGEVIKHGLIKNADYYNWILQNQKEIWSRDPGTCLDMIRESNLIKRAVVELDPKEKGDRMLLNFGHTLGHAIEKLMDFKLLHGECVALGSLAAMELSRIKGYLTAEDVNNFRQGLLAFNIPVTISGIDKNEIIRASKNDKKMEAGSIKFILLKRIGCAFVDKSITDEEMLASLAAIYPQEAS